MTIEVREITSEAEWLDWRLADMTASVAPALLGLHPRRTAYSLWREKRGELPPEAVNAAMDRGTELEPVAINRIAKLEPTWRLERPQKYYRWLEARLGATPDLFAWAPERPGKGVIQIKSAAPGSYRLRWVQEDGTVEPPMYVVVQAAIEAQLTGASWCMVAVLVVDWGIDLHLIEVPMADIPELIDRVAAETKEFWQQIDAGHRPPLDWKRDRKLFEAFYPSSPPAVDLSSRNDLPALFDERVSLGKIIGEHQERREELKTMLLDAMDGAETARLADGRVLTARRVNKKGYPMPPTSYINLQVQEMKSK